MTSLLLTILGQLISGLTTISSNSRPCVTEDLSNLRATILQRQPAGLRIPEESIRKPRNEQTDVDEVILPTDCIHGNRVHEGVARRC
ncbi:uncharacterized protein BDV17DRAFT_186397 [Aspergillus undulatus]|uniref:uncharacterized protein n=1 Tax=Aspergillus undulatus TaxID=1810928 RepID=UPI003CCE527B